MSGTSMSAATDLLGVAKESSRKTAVVAGIRSMTYADVLAQADALASALDRLTPRGAPAVALMCRHAVNAIPVAVACIVSGRTYMPLDAGNPPARVLARMRNSGAGLLVSDCMTAGYSQDFEPPVDIGHGVVVSTLTSPRSASYDEPGRWLYYLNTSGTSGDPKCVAHSWSDVVQTVRSYSQAVGIAEDSRMAMLASLGHDAAVVDMYSSLLNGATLICVDSASPMSMRATARRTARLGITLWHCVPTVLELVANHFPPVGPNGLKIVLGGESVRAPALDRLWAGAPEARVYSLYGQTECSVISGGWIERGVDDPTSLGSPLTGVDWRCGAPYVDGVGSLWVRSAAAATHQVVDGAPRALASLDGWYNTGDLVDDLGDSFSFAGRSDQVMNIAGHRVDLLEIESYISQIPGVLDCIALAARAPHGHAGVSCLLRSSRGDIPLPELNAFLAEHLPARHLLIEAVCLDRPLPRTLSGKRDRSAAAALLSQRTGPTRPVAPSGLS